MRRLAGAILLLGCSGGTASSPSSHTASSHADAACEVWTECGCEMGCAIFERVATPAGEQYRNASGALYARPDASYPLYPMAGSECTETCREAPATLRCAIVDGFCAPVP